MKEGCVAAPYLWVAFIRRCHKHLENIFGFDWVCEHVTTYADDNHLSWIIRSTMDVKIALTEAWQVLDSFPEYGMQMNSDKTVGIFKVLGTSARATRKRFIHTEGGRSVLELVAPNIGQRSLHIALVSEHIYLGACVTCASSSALTLRHRMRCGTKNFMCLRPWWSSKLSLQQRVVLWKTCVWPSLTYGLVETGLSPQSAKSLSTHVMKELRWIAHSPCFITRETNSDLLCRLGMERQSCLLPL